MFTLRRVYGCACYLTVRTDSRGRERRASLAKSDEVKELVAIEVADNGRLNRRVFFFFSMPHWPVFLFETGRLIYTVTTRTAIHMHCRKTNYAFSISYFIKYSLHQKTFWVTVVSRNLLCLMYFKRMTRPPPPPIFIELLDIQFVCPLQQKT